MRIEIDTITDGPKEYRAISAALLMLAGDIPEMDASTPSAAPEFNAPAGELVKVPLKSVTMLRNEAEVRHFFGDGIEAPEFAPLGTLAELQAKAEAETAAAVRSWRGAGTQAQNLPKEDVTLYTTPPLPPPPPAPLPPSNVVPFPPAPAVPGPVSNAQDYPRSTAPTGASLAVSVNIPQPPAPPPPPAAPVMSAGAAAAGAFSINPSLTATLVANTAEVDRSGLPWDERIHQKGKSLKKDGTWKLKKGLEPAFAQQVVQELSMRRVAPHAGYNPAADNSAQLNAVAGLMPPPPPASMVPLPLTAYGSVPVPPPPPGIPPGLLVPPPPPAPNVQIPAPGAVPQPPQPSVNAAAGVIPPYKRLMDRLTAATRTDRLDPRVVTPTVQGCGAPNLAALGTPMYENLIPAVEAAFDNLIKA